jgi:hypothetical protein
MVLLLLLASVALTGQRAGSQPSADSLRDLLKKRQAVLQEAVHVAERGYRQGEIGFVSVLDLRRDLVNARLQLATSPTQRITLYKELVENMKALERVTKRLHEAREASYIDYLNSKAARLQAEIDLIRAQSTAGGSLTASRGAHDRDGGEHRGEGHGEHGRDGHGHHGEEGEESGAQLALNETYNEVRNGARLVLAYDAQSNSFNGTVENTTDKTLKRVRVEVHLSNGKELGPTTPADLNPGQKRRVKLTATSKEFDGWTAHPEVGSGEHSHGEGHGEHDREGRSEHRETHK